MCLNVVIIYLHCTELRLFSVICANDYKMSYRQTVMVGKTFIYNLLFSLVTALLTNHHSVLLCLVVA